MEEFRLAHVVSKTSSERTQAIAEYLMTGQLKSMEEYNSFMGELTFIANLTENIREANKGEEEDE